MPRVRIDVDPNTVLYHEWDPPEWEDDGFEGGDYHWEDWGDDNEDLEDYEDDD